MLELIKISTLAATLKVSTTTIYKHLKRLKKLLEGQVTKEGGITYLTEEGARVVREAIESASTRVEVQPKPLIDVPAKIDDFGKSLLLIADEAKLTRNTLTTITEELKATRQENAALKEELRGVLTQLQAVQKLLEPPAKVAEIVPKRETPKQELKNYPVSPKREPVQESGFMKELREVQGWLGCLVSPFTELFQGK